MVELERKIGFLSTAEAYGGQTRHVEARETHMAWVFLTDTEVYKLKKPVKYAFLDFSTVAKRRLICEEELRLNRRLAAQTYKHIQPLRMEPHGRLSLGGQGAIIDWLVVMNRLPDDATLENSIVSHRFTRADADRMAETLGEFYRARAPETENGWAYLHHLHAEHEENHRVLSRPDRGLASESLQPLQRCDRAFEVLRPELEMRIRQGRIVEGHGDLRPEHVFLVEPLQIIDCLEFNRSMRILDPYDEVNYLGMECEMLGADWLRAYLLDALNEKLGHPPSPELFALSTTFRALLRARLSLVHLMESPVRNEQKWKPLAERYLAIAARECLSLPYPENGKQALRLPDA